MDLKTIAIILVLFCLMKKFMKDNFGMYNPLYSKTHQYSAPLRNPKLCANANGAHNCSSDFLPLQGAGAGFWMSKTDDQNNLLISGVPGENMGEEISMIGGNSFGMRGSDITNGYRLDDNRQVISRDIEREIIEKCRKSTDSNSCFREHLGSLRK
jgi:hypothetical protein|tara:strand:+ start:35 stop:499 length:465 start_codon:yes stop_codon:yes gene_type:complete